MENPLRDLDAVDTSGQQVVELDTHTRSVASSTSCYDSSSALTLLEKVGLKLKIVSSVKKTNKKNFMKHSGD